MNGKTLRMIIVGTLATLAVTAMPAAAATKSNTGPAYVCNQATHNSLGGALNATDGDKGSASRPQTGIKAKSGLGAGLVNAAANSPALPLCSKPAEPTPVPSFPGWPSDGVD